MPCPSPCIGVCRLRVGTEVCEGCDRTLGEIGEWSCATDDRRREILAAVASRRNATVAPEVRTRLGTGR